MEEENFEPWGNELFLASNLNDVIVDKAVEVLRPGYIFGCVSRDPETDIDLLRSKRFKIVRIEHDGFFTFIKAVI